MQIGCLTTGLTKLLVKVLSVSESRAAEQRKPFKSARIQLTMSRHLWWCNSGATVLMTAAAAAAKNEKRPRFGGRGFIASSSSSSKWEMSLCKKTHTHNCCCTVKIESRQSRLKTSYRAQPAAAAAADTYRHVTDYNRTISGGGSSSTTIITISCSTSAVSISQQVFICFTDRSHPRDR